MSAGPLHVIQDEVRVRVEDIEATHKAWPCRKGCDECCRRLASVPVASEAEWVLIADALRSLPPETANQIRERIRDSVSSARPVVCPLLDTSSGACSVYQARPIACRSYGFYLERGDVLGCHRIEAIAQESNEVVWGNHLALEERLKALGKTAELYRWLAGDAR